MKYFLTVVDEPDTPIVLTQEELDVICAEGYKVMNSTVTVSGDTTDASSISEKRNIDFAVLTTENDLPFMLDGVEVDSSIVGERFYHGLMAALRLLIDKAK